MRLLIDTQVILWWLSDDDKLGKQARGLLGEAETQVFASIASLWEVSIKQSMGKLPAKAADLANWLRELSIDILPVSVSHLVALERLPHLHRDPFDRILVAQTIAEGLTIMTSDQKIAHYGIPCIQARR